MRDQPAVLIHGLYGTLDSPELLGELDAPATASPDLLGFGKYAARAAVTLEEQADHVVTTTRHLGGPVVLIGHSLRGAVAVLVAERCPDQVAGLVLIEGNMAPADAFFSATLADSTVPAIASELAVARSDPESWLKRIDVPPTPSRVDLARHWLGRQEPEALRNVAKALVATTFAPDWEKRLLAVLEAKPFALLAGERSAGSWAVPSVVRAKALGDETVPATRHFVATEAPAATGAALRRLCALL